jgi:outer membrane protein OmpA-like peptidoglycan-associated protein
VERAKQSGAMRCAPRQLATAEANLEFMRAELAQGSSHRASEHLRTAQEAIQVALQMSKDCAPSPAPPPVVVKLEETDRDRDGVLDSLDRCPNTPGPAENQGCPVFDRDGDGVPDDEDRCPNTPGPRENAGCPVEKTYAKVEVKAGRIEIKQQIRFQTGSARIVGSDSFEVLREVAQALRDNPQINKVRIEGHTDSSGGDATNLRLSQARANAVRAELIKEGVDPSRLDAVGYGKTRPIASNSTAAGRKVNRRTEFSIIDQ